MGLYQRGKVWWIDYYTHGGKRIRRPVRPKKGEARITLGVRLQDVRQGRNPELRRIRPKPFEEMLKEFLEKHGSRCRNKESYEAKANALKIPFKGKTLQEIGP